MQSPLAPRAPNFALTGPITKPPKPKPAKLTCKRCALAFNREEFQPTGGTVTAYCRLCRNARSRDKTAARAARHRAAAEARRMEGLRELWQAKLRRHG